MKTKTKIPGDEIVTHAEDHPKDWTPASAERKQEIIKAARDYTTLTNKDKKIKIKISEEVLEQIKLKALEEGVTYQILISSYLHKLIKGNDIDTRLSKLERKIENLEKKATKTR